MRKPTYAPYNTGKVLIGSAYQPQLNNIYSADQQWLQDVLLNQPKPAPKQLSDTVLWWLYGAAIVTIVLTF